MRHILNIMAASAAILLAAVSCSKKDYQAGEQDDPNCYGVYIPSQKTSFVHEPTDAKTDTLWFGRTKSTGAITVPLILTGDTDTLKLSEVKFADGQEETFAILDFTAAELGTTYTLDIEIEDPLYASKYSVNAARGTFSVIVDKWVELGECTFSDAFMEVEDATPVLYRNDRDTHLYRMQNPYFLYDPEEYEDVQEFLNFRLLEVGDVLHEGDPELETVISNPGLVYFEKFNTGYFYDTYSAYINIYHPSEAFHKGEESAWLYNAVTQYNPDGSPAVVKFAPAYYMDGVGGWDETANQNITIVFPGAVLIDYSLKVSTYGYSENGMQIFKSSYGADIAAASYAVYEGTLSSAEVREKAALISAGQEPAAQELPDGDFVLSFEKTGPYTLVAVGFDKDNVAQTVTSSSFGYVAKGDHSKDVRIYPSLYPSYDESYGGPETSEKFSILGEDITAAKIALFSYRQADNPNYCYYMLDQAESLSESEIDKINGSGLTDIYTHLTPGCGYVLAVWATNGYKETVEFSNGLITAGKFSPTVDDICGVYEGVSFYGGEADSTSIAIEKSDDPDKGNVKITTYYGLECETPIYASFSNGKNGYASAIEFVDGFQYPIAQSKDYGQLWAMLSGFEVNYPGVLSRQWADAYLACINPATGRLAALGLYEDLYVEKLGASASGSSFDGVFGYSPRAKASKAAEVKAVSFTVSAAPADAAVTSVKGGLQTSQFKKIQK